MANLAVYKDFLGLDSLKAIYQSFFDNLIDCNIDYSYFVNWEKVKKNVNKYRVEIGILSSLVGSKDFEEDFAKIILKYPEVVKVIPLLIATRGTQIKVLDEVDGRMGAVCYDFDTGDTADDIDIKKLIGFCKKAGIENLLKSIRILNDYIYGVEVGLDSHARKNRSGEAMELTFWSLMEPIRGELREIRIFSQKKFRYIERNERISVPVNLRDRKFDFVIFKGSKKTNIEVDYFSVSGSKPQETVNSYKDRKGELESVGWNFIWVTDGPGWKGSQNQIEVAFREIDFVLNLNDVKKGFLKHILENI